MSERQASVWDMMRGVVMGVTQGATVGMFYPVWSSEISMVAMGANVSAVTAGVHPAAPT